MSEFVCKKCFKSYKKYQDLKKHTFSNQCEMVFIESMNKIAHVDVIKPLFDSINKSKSTKLIYKSYKFKCETCTNSFSTKSNLNRHIKTMHKVL